MHARWLGFVAIPLLIAVTPLAAQDPPPPARAPSADSVSVPVPARGVPSMTLEGSLGYGTTLVAEGFWQAPTGLGSTNHRRYAGRMLFRVANRVQLGFEAGHQRLYLYGVYNPNPLVALRNVASTYAAAMVRVQIDRRLTADLGAGVHLFDNSDVRPGALLGVTYHFPIGARLDLPVGVRLDPVAAVPLLVPLVLTVGVGYEWGPGRMLVAPPPPEPRRRRGAAPIPTVATPVGGGADRPVTGDTVPSVAEPVVVRMPEPEIPYWRGTRMEMTAGAGTFLLAGETGGLLGTDLRVLVPVGGVGSLGVEVGRRYGGGVESYLDHAAALWRFAVAPRLSVDVGPEVHFGPANAVGLLGVVLLHLPVNSMVDIPFGLHADAVYTRDAAFARHFFIMTSLAVGVGVRF